MAEQVGVMSKCVKSLDGLAYTNTGRNLKVWSNFEDFIHESVAQGVGIWFPVFSGAGAYIYDPPATNLRPGIVELITGTTNIGYAAIFQGQSSFSSIVFGQGQYTIEADINIPLLSTAAEEFIIRFGFGDNASGDYTDGAYFEYDRLTDVAWLLCTAQAAARTKVASPVAVINGNWIRLKIVVNALATAVDYYINDVFVGTNILNIPVGVNRVVGYLNIIKSAGATSRAVACDWIWEHIDLSASR